MKILYTMELSYLCKFNIWTNVEQQLQYLNGQSLILEIMSQSFGLSGWKKIAFV